MGNEKNVKNIIRVAICSTGELYGGVEEWIRTYCEEVVKTKGQISLCVVLFKESLLTRILREKDINVIVLPARNPSSILRVVDIYKALKKEQPDIVHTHGTKANIFYGIPAVLLKCRLVKTVHGESEPTVFLSLTWCKRFILNALDSVINNLFQGVAFVTHDIAKLRGKKCRHQYSQVIYNAIADITVDREVARNLYDQTRFNIGIIGRLSKVKGHEYLLEAIALLKNDMPNICLHIFGEGYLRAKLNSYCQKNDLLDQVVWHDFKENVLLFQAGLDFLIMPSLHEGLPYVLLYSMAFKIPVVASSIGGLKEILRDKYSAFLVPIKDSMRLAATIKNVYDYPLLGREVAWNAFRDYKKHFSIVHMVEKYHEFYNMILEGRL